MAFVQEERNPPSSFPEIYHAVIFVYLFSHEERIEELAIKNQDVKNELLN